MTYDKGVNIRMTKAEQRKALMELRDASKNPEFEKVGYFLYSKGDQYEKLGSWLKESSNLDVNYMEHMGESENPNDFFADPDSLTFKECCTALTFIFRSEHWSDGSFSGYLKDGTVYKLLSRAVETM